MSDEWPLSEEIRNVECYTDEYGVQCPLVMDEERVDWANRAAVLEADNARFRDALGQAQADSSWHRSEAARLMNLLIEAQANGNHLRRALEWLNEQSSGCIHPDGECYDIAQPGDLAPDCHPCRMAFAMAAAAGRDLRAFWNEWVSNGNDTTAALAATKEAQP
jgi:hypothetical protein